MQFAWGKQVAKMGSNFSLQCFAKFIGEQTGTAEFVQSVVYLNCRLQKKNIKAILLITQDVVKMIYWRSVVSFYNYHYRKYGI